MFGSLIVNSGKVTFLLVIRFQNWLSVALPRHKLYWYKSFNPHPSDPSNNEAFFSWIYRKLFALTVLTSVCSLMTKQLSVHLAELVCFHCSNLEAGLLVIGKQFRFFGCKNYHRRIIWNIQTSTQRMSMLQKKPPYGLLEGQLVGL